MRLSRHVTKIKWLAAIISGFIHVEIELSTPKTSEKRFPELNEEAKSLLRGQRTSAIDYRWQFYLFKTSAQE